MANEQLRLANEGLPLVVSCESANELCNLESQKLISNSVLTGPDGNEGILVRQSRAPRSFEGETRIEDMRRKACGNQSEGL